MTTTEVPAIIYEQLVAEFKERRKPPTPNKMPKKKVVEK